MSSGPGGCGGAALGAAAQGLGVPFVPFVALEAAPVGAAEAAGDEPGQVGGADHAGLGAQLGLGDPGLRTVAATGEVTAEGIPCRADQQVVGGADTPADDEAGGIEGGGEIGDADAEPLADVLEQFDTHGVALAGQLGDEWAGDLGNMAFDPLDDAVGDRGVGRGQFTGLADQGVAGAVLLPAAAVAAGTAVPAGDDLHVAELAGHAVLAALDLAVLEDRAADAGAERDHDEVLLTAARAEAPLGPGRGVGVVVDHDGDGEACLEGVAERLVAPGEVRGEEHGGPLGVDPAGRADADGVDVVPVGEVQDQFDDGVLDHLGALGLVGRLGADLLQDGAVGVDHPGHDLRTADVDAHGGHPGAVRWERRSRVPTVRSTVARAAPGAPPARSARGRVRSR